MEILTKHLLNSHGLNQKWSPIVIGLAKITVDNITPCSTHMDIRRYVKIKKVNAGEFENSHVIRGLCFSKNVRHKMMKSSIKNARLLLLRTSIEYQRVENKYSSLEPQLLQENDFLKNCAARIAALKPDVVFVENTVASIALQYLLKDNITVITNVKKSVMDRLSRMNQVAVVTTVDGLINSDQIGCCSNFTIKSFSTTDGKVKNVAILESDKEESCYISIILRGDSLQELNQVSS